MLCQAYAQAPSIDLLEAIIRLEKDPVKARGWYLQHMSHRTSLLAASRWIAGLTLYDGKHHALVQRSLESSTKPLMRYRCAACGFEATRHFWHCPGCQAWDSYPPRRIEEL